MAMDDSVIALQRTARRFSYWLPGAGFGLLGYPIRAAVCIATSWWVCGALLALAEWMSPAALAMFVLAMLAAIAATVYEQWRLKRFVPRRNSPPRRTYLALAVVTYVAVAGTIVVAVRGIDVVLVVGNGMAPTVQDGDRLVYTERFRPGSSAKRLVVIFKRPDEVILRDQMDKIVGRILAESGDRLWIENGRYMVNGYPTVEVRSHDSPEPIFQVPEAPDAITVPEGHYFIVQDGQGYDSRYLSWVPRENVLSDRFLVFDRSGKLQTGRRR